MEPVERFLNRGREKISNGRPSRDQIKELASSAPDEFARRFFIKNLIKSSFIAALYTKHFFNNNKIVDLGTGPGTFIFGVSVGLGLSNVIGVDKSEKSLLLAKTLFDVAGISPPLLIRAEIPSGIISGDDFYTASYMLAEFDRSELREFCSFVARRSRAQFLVVDYPDVIKELQSGVGRHRSTGAGRFELNLPPSLADKVGDDKISFGVLYAPRVSVPGFKSSEQLATAQHLTAHGVVRR
jgi:hypothetical protein